jgi:hypothetical protein
MNTTHAAIAGLALLTAVGGPAMAQTGTAPSSGTRQPVGADAVSERHSMGGTITRLDEKKGWIHLETDAGTLIVRVPPTSLQGLKTGDTVVLHLALKDNGPARSQQR